MQMSRSNADLLEWALEQLFESRRLHPDLLASDAEWVNPHDAVEPGTRSGAEEFNAAIARIFATWDVVRLDIERTIDNGDDLIALGLLRGCLEASGMKVDSPHGQIWTFRDGQVIRMRWFNTHGETLEAAGLVD